MTSVVPSFDAVDDLDVVILMSHLWDRVWGARSVFAGAMTTVERSGPARTAAAGTARK